MTDRVSDKFLEMVVAGDEVVWTEAHDMAVELIKARKLIRLLVGFTQPEGYQEVSVITGAPDK